MDLASPDPVELARTVEELAESLDDRRTSAEVRAHAKKGLALVALGLVLGVAGTVFDGPWPWAPLAVLAALTLVPVLRMLRTGNAIHHRVDPGVLARRILEAPWPASEGVVGSLELRSRIQELGDRLGLDGEGRHPLPRRLGPWGYGGLAVATFGLACWAAVVVGEPWLLAPVTVLVAALGLAVRSIVRRNGDIDRAAELLDGILDRMGPPDRG